MQHFRAGLTRLKSQMESRLPDGNDIFGYPGVSKALLVSAIDLAYILSQEIDERDDTSRFEVISLKRHGSDVYRDLKDFLESNLAGRKVEERFNDFLNSLSSLIEKTKLVYFIVTKNGLRDDQEIASIRSRITELQEVSNGLAIQKDSLKQNADTINEHVSDVVELHQTAKVQSAAIAEWYETTEKQYTEISKTHEAIEGWDADIQEHDAKFNNLSEQIGALLKEAQKLKEGLESQMIEWLKDRVLLEATKEENEKMRQEIRETLGDANRVGMGASFKERKKELASQQVAWQAVFIITIALIVTVANFLVLPELIKQSRDWNQILGELALISPLIWLGWFAAKQYSYISRIREDYAFKYAASMAYEGHKKATREVDLELERVLLEFSLFNMSQNPIRLYSKHEDHATPLHELTATIFEKLPSFRKMTGQIPTLGRFEIETEPKKMKEEKGGGTGAET